MRFPAPKNDFIPARGPAVRTRLHPFQHPAQFADQLFLSPLNRSWLDPALPKEVSPDEPDF